MVSWNNWFPVLAWTQPAARAVKLHWTNATFPSDCLLLSVYKHAISSSWYSMIGLKRLLAARIEEVILELVRTKCTPILLYGLECFQLGKAKRYSLDFTFSRLCMKLFWNSEYWCSKRLSELHCYYIHLYSHKLQLQKLEIKKKTKEKGRHTTCQRAQRVKCILTIHSGTAR